MRLTLHKGDFMENDMIFFTIASLGTTSAIYYTVSLIIGKKQNPVIVTNLLFLNEKTALIKK
jgi:hypothetical protein